MQTTKEKQSGFDIFLRVMIAVSAVFWVLSLSPCTIGTFYFVFLGSNSWFLLKIAEVVFAVILFVYTIRKVSETVVRRLFTYGLVLILTVLFRGLGNVEILCVMERAYHVYWRSTMWIFTAQELICSLLLLVCWFLMIKKPKKSKHTGMVVCIITVLSSSVAIGVVLTLDKGIEGLIIFWVLGNWWKMVCCLSYCLWIRRMREAKANGRNVPRIAGVYVGPKVAATDNSCPECGKPYDEDDAFCGGCGHRFTKFVCPECGKEGDVGDCFCKKCGIHLVEVWKKEEPAAEEKFFTCINCGEKMPITNHFCIRCGTPQTED